MITPWDVWRYGFWGGCALIFSILGVSTVVWLFNRLESIIDHRRSEVRELSYKLSDLSYKYQRLEAKQDKPDASKL